MTTPFLACTRKASATIAARLVEKTKIVDGDVERGSRFADETSNSPGDFTDLGRSLWCCGERIASRLPKKRHLDVASGKRSSFRWELSSASSVTCNATTERLGAAGRQDAFDVHDSVTVRLGGSDVVRSELLSFPIPLTDSAYRRGSVTLAGRMPASKRVCGTFFGRSAFATCGACSCSPVLLCRPRGKNVMIKELRGKNVMIKELPLYPLRFTPIYQYRLWGGRRLENWLKTPLPSEEPIGEAWILSDREDHPSRVAEGPLKGRTIAQLLEQSPTLILGKLAPRFQRFPLLLKFLDVREMLSVQVHPPDSKAGLIPKGETGKTEAWVILEAMPESRVYAGLKPGANAEDLRALSKHTVNNCLAGFTPQSGQGVFIEAGVVHALGDGLVVFEIQQNSDVTFRLYDWDHVDPKTGHSRPLQVEQALACIDLTQGPICPIAPMVEAMQPALRERLFDGPHFRLWRLHGAAPFVVGAADEPRVLVCLEGVGNLEHDGAEFMMEKGAVMLLPAAVGACRFRPGRPVTLLDIAIPAQP